ncbi:MAG: TonB-dependent receptor [Lutibacter sp.]|jgi:TonB-linked SusC/RagA family outer membrane protein
MKLTALLLIVSVLSIHAGTYSQNTKITLNLESVNVMTVLEKIESLTEFKFLGNDNVIDKDRIVSINVKQKRVDKILFDLFLNTDITFKVIGAQIILVKKKDIDETQINSERGVEKYKQQKEISGKVTDNNGMPLPGASIIIKGTNTGTTTDFDGNFTLMINEDSVILIVSYIGFGTQEIPINNQTVFKIKLESEASSLDEVVIIGYGSVSKKELTGAVATAENIENRAVTKVEEALQGSVSGVTVLANGGDPTSTPSIKIRGLGTTSAEKPLWIVDGAPYYGGPINPFDIESLTVLKDAASASIYGVRAAAGVILVTTKKGKKGDIKVDFAAYTGVQSVYNKPVALNAQQYTDMYNIAYDNSGIPRLDYFDGVKNPDRLVQRTNWVDEIFRNAIIQNYDVGLRGGSEKYSFSSSLGYNKKEGILINTYADRISFRYNSTVNLSDKIKVGENLSYTVTNGQSAFTGTQAADGGTNYNGVIAAAIKAPPFVSMYNPDGTYSDVADGQNGDVLHPVATLNRIDIDNPIKNTFGNIFLEYKPADKLNLRSSYAINHSDEFYKEFDPRVPEASKVQKTTNTLTQIQANEINWSWENTLNYNTIFNDKHSFQLLGGYSLQHQEREVEGIIAQGFENEDSNLLVLPLADEILDVNYSFFENNLVSFFSRVLYDYNKKYFFSASIRRDGSSKLAKDKRWENFPSVALGWSLSEEEFFKSDFVSSLKLRASWGRVGNIESLSSYPTNLPLSDENIILGGSGYQTGIVLDGRSNPNITWEISETTNFGLDFASQDNRWTLTADYFIKDTDRWLNRTPVSPLEGIGESPFQNSGKIRNKGLELELGYNKDKGDFTYNISGNVSFIKNEILEIAEGFDIIYDNTTQVATHYPLANAVGEPLFSFYLIETDGLLRTDTEVTDARANGQPDAQLGDIRFVDKNGDKKINDDDRVFKGSAFPTISYGLNLTMNYKRFDLSLFLQGTQGGVAYNGFKLTTTYPAHTSVAGANLLNEALDTWYPGNPNASNPRLSINDPNANLRKSDFWLEDTDYLRIKNISIGYTFPDIPYLEKLRVYATAQNLLTWTSYSGLDPEVANYGVDGGQYPVSRAFTLGFNLTLK